MTWRIEDPQGRESAKVRFDLVPYMAGRVLDLGCGDDKVFPIAIGVDNKIDAKLYGLQINPDVPVSTCERLDMFADGSADTVFSSHLLEHIVDHEAALREWWRLVKVGGYLVLYLPHRDHYPRMGTEGANRDHKHDFAPEDITAAMTSVASASGAGWDQVEDQVRSGGNEYSFLQVYRKRADSTTVLFTPKPKPEKTLGIVRLGAFGDALWASAVFPWFKSQGYHITVYTQPQGEEMLRHDPNVDRIICQPHGLLEFTEGKVGMWQTAYWLHEERKYDQFINLVGSVERRILPQFYDPEFYLPHEQRHRLMNRNYLEAVFEYAGAPYDRKTARQKFYPTADELAWAATERAKIDGPVVLINPSGSSPPKWWPYAQELADMLAAEAIHSRIVGDMRLNTFRPSGKYGRQIGMEWPLRKLLAFAALADVVVGEESVLVNSVAYEAPLKIVLLSHSTHENLTRDWHATIAIEPEGLPCAPCHRIHTDMTHCTYEKRTNSAGCQAVIKPEGVLEVIIKHLAEVNAQRREAA